MPVTTPTPTGYSQTSVRSRLAFHWRARDLSLTPLTSQSPTFTRTTAGGLVRDQQGRGHTQIAKRERWHFEYDENGVLVPTSLLEGQRTNQFTRSEELDHADWTNFGLSAVTADQATGPDGASSMDALVEDSSSTSKGVRQTVTLTADATYALSFFVIGNDIRWVRLRLNASGNNVDQYFDLTNKVKGQSNTGGTGALVRSYFEDWTDVASGLYRIVLVGSVGSGQTSIEAELRLADSNGGGGYTGDGSSSLYAGYAMLEDQANFASSYLQTVGSTVTRNAENVQYSWAPPFSAIKAAGGLTVMSEFIDLGIGITGTASRYWQIGGSGASSTPLLQLTDTAGSDGRPAAFFDDGTNSGQSQIGAGTTSLFDHVRIRTVLFDDSGTWKIQVHVSVNGGAETSASAASIGSSLPSAWSADTLTIGATPADTLHSYAGHIAHKFALGNRSEAFMNGVL